MAPKQNEKKGGYNKTDDESETEEALLEMVKRLSIEELEAKKSQFNEMASSSKDNAKICSAEIQKRVMEAKKAEKEAKKPKDKEMRKQKLKERRENVLNITAVLPNGQKVSVAVPAGTTIGELRKAIAKASNGLFGAKKNWTQLMVMFEGEDLAKRPRLTMLKTGLKENSEITVQFPTTATTSASSADPINLPLEEDNDDDDDDESEESDEEN